MEGTSELQLRHSNGALEPMDDPPDSSNSEEESLFEQELRLTEVRRRQEALSPGAQATDPAARPLGISVALFAEQLRVTEVQRRREALPLPTLQSAIDQAIRDGVPLWNSGDCAGCAEVYKSVAVRYQDSEPRLAVALCSCEGAPLDASGGSQASIMRQAFDSIFSPAAAASQPTDSSLQSAVPPPHPKQTARDCGAEEEGDAYPDGRETTGYEAGTLGMPGIDLVDDWEPSALQAHSRGRVQAQMRAEARGAPVWIRSKDPRLLVAGAVPSPSLFCSPSVPPRHCACVHVCMCACVHVCMCACVHGPES
jgi:hypothetical protein